MPRGNKTKKSLFPEKETGFFAKRYLPSKHCFFGNPAIPPLGGPVGFVPPGYPEFTFSETYGIYKTFKEQV
jgi:hypothetical protein